MIEATCTDILPSALPPPRTWREAADLARISNYYACKLSLSAHALDRAGAPAAYALSAQYLLMVRPLREGAAA